MFIGEPSIDTGGQEENFSVVSQYRSVYLD